MVFDHVVVVGSYSIHWPGQTNIP